MPSKRTPARVAVLLLSAALLVSRPALAVDPNRALTQYVHRIWQVQQGLPQATIYAMLQDSDGYLWLGTQSGLVRFDGVRFTPIDAGPLRGAWVQSLIEDRQGIVWVGTRDQGLWRVRHGVVSRDPRTQGLPDNVRTLLVDRKGDLWVSMPDSGTVARISATRLIRYDANRGLPNAAFDAACQADDGTIWLGRSSADLSIWNGAGFLPYHLAAVPHPTAVHAMLCAGDGALWIGTAHGLVRVKDGRQVRLTTADGLSDDDVLALAESREGGLWAGTRNGFSRLRPGDVESFRSEDGLSQSTVYTLFEDREGSFWVGTKHGLNQFFDGRTIPYTTKEGLPSNETGPLIQDARGHVWVGTLDAGLGRYDGHHFTGLNARNGLPSNDIRALARDEAGDLWVGTDRGLSRVRDGRVDRVYSRTSEPSLPGTDAGIRALAFDRTGVLWVGTSRGLTTLRAGRFTSTPATGLPAGLPIAALALDGTGQMVAAVEGDGVYVFTGDRWEEMRAAGGPIRNVDALYADADGHLWMGTFGAGLLQASGSRVLSYTMRDGLFDDEIYGIVGDAAGRLWMACSKGIFSANRADLLKVSAGEARTFVSTPYSPTDALRTIECRSGVQPAVWAMRDGRLWFSTIRGVIVIDPSHTDHRLPPPQVVVESVTVNGQQERPTDVAHLPSGAKNVAFTYTALSFVVPTRITFRYMLDGFDRDWTDAGTRRESFYTNLPPGQFRFRVQACNVDGKCAETAHAVALAIAPRLYQRAWFWPSFVALAALSVWLLYRRRVRRLRAQFAIVLAERTRIARELHDTLIQGFAGVTMQLQALAGRVPPSPDRSNLEEIIREAGWSLREARRSLAGLRSVQGGGLALAKTIARTARQVTEGKNVRLKLKIDGQLPDVAANTAYNLQRIAQEAVSNATTHAGAVTIEVTLHGTPGALALTIRDDGSGFEADPAGLMQAGHYGLVGMRERAEEIGATFEVDSARGEGTRVTVTVPLVRPGEPEEPRPIASDKRKTG